MLHTDLTSICIRFKYRSKYAVSVDNHRIALKKKQFGKDSNKFISTKTTFIFYFLQFQKSLSVLFIATIFKILIEI